MEIFRIENLSFKYPESESCALKNVSFSIKKGEFVVLCGRSGCGKTTLLRLLKPEISPFGEKKGDIFFDLKPLSEIDSAASASKIGFVLQSVENQIVSDKVKDELAFGLENLGVKPDEIRRKIAEIAEFFGMESWYDKNTSELSGGEKQLLSLASVMAMSPEVIILDEPSSQLDPISTESFFNVLKRINEQLGVTIIMSEHHLEDCFSMADKIIALENGSILLCEEPGKACKKLFETDMRDALPAAARIFGNNKALNFLPITVKEGRAVLFECYEKSAAPLVEINNANETAVELKDVWFRYEKKAPDVLKGLNLKIKKGELCCILGGNGVGKSTALNVISGLAKAYHGKVSILGEKISSYKNNSLYKGILSYLPQDPRTVFVRKTVLEDFEEGCQSLELNKEESKKRIDEIASLLGITELLNRHPGDLSGGELQKCALGRVLLSNPRILLLDEPTKAVDAFAKKQLGDILSSLAQNGVCVIAVTHDVEFAGEFAHTCGLLFNGEIVSWDNSQSFFASNHFYTTASCRIAKDMVLNAVTAKQVSESLVLKNKGEL